jgi:phasin
MGTGRIGAFSPHPADESPTMAKPTKTPRSVSAPAKVARGASAIAKKAAGSTSAVAVKAPAAPAVKPLPAKLAAAAKPSAPRKPRVVRTKAAPARPASPPAAAAEPRPHAEPPRATPAPVARAITPRPSDESFFAMPAPVAPVAVAKASAEAIAAPLRSAADTSLNQAREAYAALRQGSDKLTSGIDASTQAAAKGLHDFGATLIGAMQANANAAFGFVKALASVKSVSEAIELQSRVAREQFETVRAQSKELGSIAGRTVTAAAEPLRDVLNLPGRRAS